MNQALLPKSRLRQAVSVSGILFFVFALLQAPALAAEEEAEQAAAKKKEEIGDDSIVSLAAYNVKADRIEDFGLRVAFRVVGAHPSAQDRQPNLATLWFTKFTPMVTAVVPNTAAAKAGLQPGDRILKSDDRSTVGAVFSLGPSGNWEKAQKKKWAEVGAGKTNVTWTLEVETPATKAVRTVKLVVPTPPPRWGASVWRAPEGRSPSKVPESGPLAECSRVVLDNGIWTLLTWPLSAVFEPEISSNAPPTVTGYAWRIGVARDGMHEIFVTQFGGRTRVFLQTASPATGWRVYLTSPSGALEKAWLFTRQYKGEISLDQSRRGFEYELDLWTTKVDKISSRWPLELKPGYDPNAIFAVLAGKADSPARTAAARATPEFAKLPQATEAQQSLFSDAYRKLGAESESWAYTETTRAFDNKRVTVTRVDPSKPEAERCVLLSVNGKPPTPAAVEEWQADGGDVPKPLGDVPPLESMVDLKEIRVYKEDSASVVFELPLRSGGDFPAEKFQALFRVNKTHRAFEDINIKLRGAFSVGGLAKVTDAGVEVRLQAPDPGSPPQPIYVKAGGGVRVLLVKLTRSFETTRTDFKRVSAPEAGEASPK